MIHCPFFVKSGHIERQGVLGMGVEQDDAGRDVKVNIVNLDQKLKGLQAEVEAKLNHADLYAGSNKEEYIARLTELHEEINTALSGIKTIVDVIAADTSNELSELYLSEDIQVFNQELTDHLAKITRLRDIF
jgi:iron-sulfur cluster repair protein YtfE (RIC family)